MNHHRRAAALFALAPAIALLAPRAAFGNDALAEQLSAGVWRSLVLGGTNEYAFPLTALGQTRLESYRLDQDSSLRCEPPGMPRAFYNLSPMALAFEGDMLTIFYETMDVVRTVQMGGAPPPESAPHTPNGHSVGRWEGETLVVETSHLAAGETTRDGVPKSELMTLRETFLIEEEAERPRLVVSVTISDSENFIRPFTTVDRFVLEPDWELLPFDCHPTEY
jgi:hypothetical protein